MRVTGLARSQDFSLIPPASTSFGAPWGICAASERKLLGVVGETVAQLRYLDPRLARKTLSMLELCGVACLALEHVSAQRKGCVVTRSSGEPVTTLAGMLEAVAAYGTWPSPWKVVLPEVGF